MRTFVALLVILGVALALEESQTRFLFENFRAQNGKMYKDAHEAVMRYDIFKHNVEKIQKMQSEVNFQVGITQFADMTSSEFEAYVNQGKYKSRQVEKFGVPADMNPLPEEIDWVKKGAVRPMKNQGQCGSCWAFSATAATEALHFIKTQKLIGLSEQQLVDCVKTCHGCRGGRMDYAWEWLKGKEGQCTEEEYPYTAKDGQCKQCKGVSPVTGYVNLPSNDCPALKAAAAQQVVSVAVMASSQAWQFYRGGVIDSNCQGQLNHAVALVGYGKDGKDYWFVRNSWGANWGEKGYVRILRTDTKGQATMCGIGQDTCYPTRN